MNTTITPTRNRNFWRRAGALTFSSLLLVLPGAVQAQTDDFDDGNDTGWTRYSPLAIYGIPGVFSFPNGGYRIQTTLASGMANNPGRAGSIRQDVSYTEFYVTVDVVNWNDNAPQAFGIVARVANLGLGTTVGYSFTYDRGNPATSTSGGFDISRITGEVPTTISPGSHPLHLNPANDYRFVFIGKGSALEGRVYQLPNLDTPVITVTATDTTYASGNCGLVVFDNSGGNGVTDATFDNYFAAADLPPKLTYQVLPDNLLLLTWPITSTGFRLQGSPTLSDWLDVDTGSDMGNGYWGVYQSTAGGNLFYRLAK